MACKTSYELHHHFPKIAEESGFTFNVHRPRTHIDWHKIRLIDIESIIKERKFYLIEQHLNDILYCVLESEFDVRILDEGVMKMFRLAQLAVEYQQFCRHYLDRSVYVLREEITSLAQELDITKKNLHEKEEELRKIKRKTKHTYRTPLTYGNDNIATMILKTLTNKGDIFPSTSNRDALQYNKCSYCDKVFLNQLYLKSHLSRRHSNMADIPQKDTTDNGQNTYIVETENSKLNSEIIELKSKLQEMESLLTKVNEQKNAAAVLPATAEVPNQEHKTEVIEKKTRDAEVSTNNESYLLDKIEEWKKEEHEKYNKEINLLRTQIVDIVNSFKSKEAEKPQNNDSNLIEQLHMTIKQQGAEINSLKQELGNTKLKSDNEEILKKKESEAQMSFWTKRLEAQTQQYETLLQKLNDVAQEARAARAQADAEKARAAQLQMLLQESLNNKNKSTHNVDKLNHEKDDSQQISNGDIKKKTVKRKPHKTNPVTDHRTLESLHKKAQELLNMGTITSSDTSSTSEEKVKPREQLLPKNSQNTRITKLERSHRNNKVETNQNRNKSNFKNTEKLNKISSNQQTKESSEVKEQKPRKEKSKSHSDIPVKMGNGTVIAPGSPVKLVRAKITEEVNCRLVSIRVDPLKNRLPKSFFQEQKMQLQQQHESKSKKNPEYQKVKHSILAYLDSTTLPKKKENPEIQDYVSPHKISKAFSLTSVISNVKSKALSLVKSNDISNKARRELNADVAKRAMTLLKTPPESAPTSPIKQRKMEELKLPSETDTKSHFTKRKSTNDETPLEKGRGLVTKKQMKTDYTDDDSTDSDHRYYNPAVVQQATKAIDNLIKSPARRPSSANAEYNSAIRKLIIDDEKNMLRSQSAVNITSYKEQSQNKPVPKLPNHDNSADESTDTFAETSFKKAQSEANIPKLTKGVLKNASSISSLNKKRVLFDMDAIQMKSVSASPSQSITEKSDNNEKYELGLVNLDGEEWDISSIDNEPLKNDTKIQVNSRTSPKIAELKHTIESQLARRTETPSTAIVGGVNLLPATLAKTSSIAGSNTSLGSSILDESEGIPVINHKAFIKPKNIAERDDSEIDISEYSLDGMTNNKKDESF